MQVVADTWVAGVLARPAFRVDLGDRDEDGDIVESLAAHARAHARAFYSAKVDTSGVRAVKQLGRAGFSVVDVNVTFDMAPPDAVPASNVDVGECTVSASDAVLDIAASCFRFTRFHLDPSVGISGANALKRAWVESYLRKARGDRLFVAYVEGRPAGFLAALVTEHAGRKSGVIDLVGVSSTMQRRGIGAALINAFANHYRGKCDSLVVGTQVANIPSIRLYEKLGFSLRRSQYVLHKHSEG